MMQIVVGCEADTCVDHQSVLLQYRKDARCERHGPYSKTLSHSHVFLLFKMANTLHVVSCFRSDLWQLVQSECLPSSVNNVGCSPFQFHESTIYSPVNSSTWTRVTVQLPDHVSSG